MSRPRITFGVLPEDRYARFEAWPRIGRLAKHELSAWTVTYQVAGRLLDRHTWRLVRADYLAWSGSSSRTLTRSARLLVEAHPHHVRRFPSPVLQVTILAW